ncbi:MAG: hypothetical protein OXE73_16765 [Gammaproteobacteria bacterium]|nr:hypothetical protein [Gammaproteobacteria bacterium]
MRGWATLMSRWARPGEAMTSWERCAGAARVAFCAALMGLPAAGATPTPASPQELPAPPSLRVAVDTTTTTVGGRLHLTVAVEHAPDATVQWPDSLDLAPFEVLDAVVNPTTLADGRATTTAVLTLTAFELGELEIPSFTVGVASRGGVSDLVTDPFGIAVASVGLDEGQDIRDIRGPLSIPRSWLAIGLWLLALVLAAGGGWWLARRARQRTTDEGPVTEGPPRPAHETAYEELEWLESSGLLAQGRIKEYHIEVSDIIRRYLEGRYAIRAPEMTSREVLEHLERTDIAWDVHDRFSAFMEHCDLVKFAKHRPSPTACALIVPDARALVDATLPPPEPELDEDTEGDRGQDGVSRDQGRNDARAEGEPEAANSGSEAAERGPEAGDAGPEAAEGGPETGGGAGADQAGPERQSVTGREGAQPRVIPLASGEGR